MVTFRILGPFEVRAVSGQPISVRRRKQRALLALLVVRPGQPAGIEELIDVLWGRRPPVSARANLHSYISELRRLLADRAGDAPPRLLTTPAGYRLDLGVDDCDAETFERLAARGGSTVSQGRPEDAVELLSRALGMWRGGVLEDLGAYEWIQPVASRLEQARLCAFEDRAAARLRLGQHAEAAAELAGIAAAHPLRESLWYHYLLALDGAGRRADALNGYRTLCAALANELGVQPDETLRSLYDRIRGAVQASDGAAAPAVRAASSGTGPPADSVASRPAPALLPPDIADFTGREAETHRLLTALAPKTAAEPRAPVVAGITGMGGVGKTTLAVHVAHLAAPSYPDGQLYVNLRGEAEPESSAAQVLGRFLRALGVDSRAVPGDPVERAEMYRSLLAGRRVLIVIDNATVEHQVRPLLPGAETCAVVITGRFQLTGVNAVRWTSLDVLDLAKGTLLLSQVLDDHRVREQPAEATEIVRLCGGLPLAIRIAGARLAARRSWRIGHLVALLRHERHRLAELTTGDLEVRASLALSYDALAQPARQLFRRLGLVKVPDFAGWLAAAVWSGPPQDASVHLETLVDAHLVAVAGTDTAGQLRYRFHDLVRIYARERAAAEDSPAQRLAVLQRGLGAFLGIAEQMAVAVPGPCYARISGSAPRPPIDWKREGVLRIAPLTWFDTERPALLAAVRQACRAGLDELAFDLAGCLEKYLDMRGMYADWEHLSRLVIASCRDAGNALGEAVMLRGLIDLTTWITTDHSTEAMTRSLEDSNRLQQMFTALNQRGGMSDASVMCAWALTAQGDHSGAIDAATQALRWAEESDHVGGQARAHVALAVAYGEQRQIDAALGHLHEALTAARALGNDRYEATVLQFLGIGHREVGNLDLSEALLNDSLAISRRHRDRYVEVLSMLALTRVHLLRGQEATARTLAVAALEMAREYRMSHHVADALGLLGEIDLAAGRPVQAVEHLRESVAMWRTRGWLSFQAAALATLGRALSSIDPLGAREAFDEASQLYRHLGHPERANELTALLTTA